tara:strand:- start:353 stop:595 length:243 start_codon:yes stop_codon:yes gene_type:complete
MKNKKLIELITELKQQLDESRDTDFDNYVGKLSKRASKVISELEVDNVVSDDVIKCECKYNQGIISVCNYCIDSADVFAA